MTGSFSKIFELKRRFHVLILFGLTLAVALPGLSALQVIDRDEARFAQASVQMAESNDFLNIRFQDEARNKKPAGIYWLQVAALKAFSSPDKRQIWVQRLPSVLGALLAVFAVYWGGAVMVGRKAAFIGGAALALSFMLVFEAHIAKTDAVLCGLAAVCFAAIAHIRMKPAPLSLWKARPAVWAFWLALGASVFVKGPVVPILILLTLSTLLLWEKRGYGIRQLVNIPAILAALLLFIPWAIAIGLETQGAFFTESLGNDFGGKLVSAQESHPGPPGYHLALISITLWPGSLLLLPAVGYAFKNLRGNSCSEAPLNKALRLCAAWIVPYWILIELMPTKLPHYSLPLFPALGILIGLVGAALLKTNGFKKTKTLSAAIYLAVGMVLAAVLLAAQTLYDSRGINGLTLVFLVLSLILMVCGAVYVWRNKMSYSLVFAGLSALVLNMTAYGNILPSLDKLKLADRLVDTFERNNIPLPRDGGPRVQAVNFTEPSLVYQLGKEVRLGGQIDMKTPSTWSLGNIFIIDDREEKGERFDRFLQIDAKENGHCLKEHAVISGNNYSRGDGVNLHVLEVVVCEKS